MELVLGLVLADVILLVVLWYVKRIAEEEFERCARLISERTGVPRYIARLVAEQSKLSYSFLVTWLVLKTTKKLAESILEPKPLEEKPKVKPVKVKVEEVKPEECLVLFSIRKGKI